MKKNSVQIIVFTGLMVALGVVLSQFFSISLPNPQSPIIKFGLGYFPIIIVSVLFGPLFGFFAAVSQDLIGFFLIGGANGQIFHLGFTLNAALYGLIPGLLFARKIALKDQLFKIINYALVGLFFFVITLYLFNPDLVISQSLDLAEKYILMSVSIGASIALIILNFWVKKFKKSEFDPHKILFVILLLYMMVSLILTPSWNYMLINHLSFFQINVNELSSYILVVLPLRIVKMPIEVMAYVFLLIPVLNLLKRLIEHRDFDESETGSN